MGHCTVFEEIDIVLVCEAENGYYNRCRLVRWRRLEIAKMELANRRSLNDKPHLASKMAMKNRCTSVASSGR